MKPAAERLPAAVKLAFGAPSFAGAGMGIAIGVLLPRFYSDVVLAPLGMIAIAIAAARAFDALTDPVMGWVSDHTRTRWGRRKPFVAVGGPFAALAFYLLFSPPEGMTPPQASVWFVACFTFFFLCTTVIQVPYSALGAELSLDYGERSSLFGYRAMFIAAGMIAGATLPALLESTLAIDNEHTRYRILAATYALLLVGLGILMLVRVRERPEFVRRESNPLVPGVRRALRNAPFRILLLAAIAHAVPAAIPAILMPYFVGYVLQPEQPGTWVGIFLGLYMTTGLCFVPLWMFVARRVGKLGGLLIPSAIGTAASIFFFFAGPGDLFFVGCIYFVTGAISMANNFLVPAMVADTIDYDEFRTGKRREAQFTAFLTLVPKFVAIPGSSIPLAIIAAVGYVPNQVQTEEVLFWIRFMYSIFPASFYVIALLIIARYPISEVVHRKISEGIDARASGNRVIDPVTGKTLSPRGSCGVTENEGWFLDHFAPGELRRAVERGPGHLVTSVRAALGLSSLVCLGATFVAVDGMHSVAASPPPTTVFAVVVAGLALTACLFHALRLRPARRMVRSPLAPEVVRAHLEEEAGSPPR